MLKQNEELPEIKRDENFNKPLAFMLIGHQYVGKSSFVNRLRKGAYSHLSRKEFPKVYNLDEYVKVLTDHYDQDFLKVANEANKILEEDFKKWLADKRDIIFDRTNTTKKSRMRLLNILKKNGYGIHAIYWPALSDEEIQKRIATRPNQVVPFNIVQEFRDKLEPIDDEECKYYDNISYIRVKESR